jgi:hypothetical protein
LGIFSAHHQEFSTVHSALVIFMQVSDDAWKCIFPAHHLEFSTVHSALVNFMQVSDDQFHPDSAWKWSSETRMKLTSAECTVENS